MIKGNCEYMNKKVYSNLEYNDSKKFEEIKLWYMLLCFFVVRYKSCGFYGEILLFYCCIDDMFYIYLIWWFGGV